MTDISWDYYDVWENIIQVTITSKLLTQIPKLILPDNYITIIEDIFNRSIKTNMSNYTPSITTQTGKLSIPVQPWREKSHKIDWLDEYKTGVLLSFFIENRQTPITISGANYILSNLNLSRQQSGFSISFISNII